MSLCENKLLCCVPAHAGGVDLSPNAVQFKKSAVVPAHAGGVDLSMTKRMNLPDQAVPAHAGGVDLSSPPLSSAVGSSSSPPMRAGWI